MNLPIIAPSGREMHRFGGDQAWKTYETAGYNVSLEWFEGEPCCVVWPVRGALDRGVYIVCLSAIAHMLNEDGRPTIGGFEMVRTGIERMGAEVTWPETFKVFDIIVTAFGEMVRMPPKKRQKPAPLFEASEFINGKKAGEREV
ncbi:MAG: hypothetical protein ACK5XA_15800 [Tagaea sp.]|jgi:hypothetical protein